MDADAAAGISRSHPDPDVQSGVGDGWKLIAGSSLTKTPGEAYASMPTRKGAWEQKGIEIETRTPA